MLELVTPAPERQLLNTQNFTSEWYLEISQRRSVYTKDISKCSKQGILREGYQPTTAFRLTQHVLPTGTRDLQLYLLSFPPLSLKRDCLLQLALEGGRAGAGGCHTL